MFVHPPAIVFAADCLWFVVARQTIGRFSRVYAYLDIAYSHWWYRPSSSSYGPTSFTAAFSSPSASSGPLPVRFHSPFPSPPPWSASVLCCIFVRLFVCLFRFTNKLYSIYWILCGNGTAKQKSARDLPRLPFLPRHRYAWCYPCL
jgi:hypothetical protein